MPNLELLNQTVNFQTNKLINKGYTAGDLLHVVAFKQIPTRNNFVCILLTEDDNVIVGNTAINKHCQGLIEVRTPTKSGVYNNADLSDLFRVAIGFEKSYLGYPYFEVDIQDPNE